MIDWGKFERSPVWNRAIAFLLGLLLAGAPLWADLQFARFGAINVGTIIAGSITDTGLTAGRVTYAGTGGLLSDEAAFTYAAATNTLTAETSNGVNSVRTPIQAPGTITVTPTCGAACVVTYGYKVVALLSDGTSHSAASAEGTTALQNATLSGTNFNTISWAAVTGATSYDVYRTTGGAAPPKKIFSATTAVSVVDDGIAGSAVTPPVDNTTGQITVGNATTASNATCITKSIISGGSATDNFLNCTGTFPTVLSSTTVGALLDFTTAGSSAQGPVGLRINLKAGWTGAGQSGAVYAYDNTVGNGANTTKAYWADVASSGFNNVGFYANNNTAQGGKNYGVFSTPGGGAVTSLPMVGVYGTVSRGGGTGSSAGGYFTLSNVEIASTGVVAALIANNATIAADIFQAQDNGSPVFTIADGGTITKTATIRGEDGGTTTPTYAFTNSTNSGWFLDAGNSAVSTSVGGAPRQWVTSSDITLLRSGGAFAWGSSATVFSAADTLLTRGGAAVIQLGAADVNGTPVNQTLRAQGAVTGTDKAGGRLSFHAGPSTGAGTPSVLAIQVNHKLGTGTTQTTPADFEVFNPGTSVDPTNDEVCLLGTHGEQWCRGIITELLTLSTVGLTTDTTNNLLPADSQIDAVVARITTTITTTTNWAVGDGTTSDRFCSANATKTAGTTSVCVNHNNPATATTLARSGSVQTAAKLRITCTGSNPGAGVVRLTVYYRRFIAPTS